MKDFPKEHVEALQAMVKKRKAEFMDLYRKRISQRNNPFAATNTLFATSDPGFPKDK